MFLSIKSSTSVPIKKRPYFRDLKHWSLCVQTPDTNLEQETLHKSSATYECNECPKRFWNLQIYQNHTKRHINKITGRYKCKCGKHFSQRSGLMSHQRIHTGSRPYSCDFCERGFADFSTCIKHRRIHTGERPYVCGFCSKTFTQSGNMHRHIRMVHLTAKCVNESTNSVNK